MPNPKLFSNFLNEYSQMPEYLPARCFRASQKVIYTDKYIAENEALQKCIDRVRAIGHEEYELLNEALEHSDAMQYMFEEASYLQGFHDVLNLVGRGRLD